MPLAKISALSSDHLDHSEPSGPSKVEFAGRYHKNYKTSFTEEIGPSENDIVTENSEFVQRSPSSMLNPRKAETNVQSMVGEEHFFDDGITRVSVEFNCGDCSKAIDESVRDLKSIIDQVTSKSDAHDHGNLDPAKQHVGSDDRNPLVARQIYWDNSGTGTDNTISETKRRSLEGESSNLAPSAESQLLSPVTSSVSGKKRRQVKSACVNCRKACKKCEEQRPCQRCVRLGIQSSCVDYQRKPREKGIKRGPYRFRKVLVNSISREPSFGGIRDPVSSINAPSIANSLSGGASTSVNVGFDIDALRSQMAYHLDIPSLIFDASVIDKNIEAEDYDDLAIKYKGFTLETPTDFHLDFYDQFELAADGMQHYDWELGPFDVQNSLAEDISPANFVAVQDNYGGLTIEDVHQFGMDEYTLGKANKQSGSSSLESTPPLSPSLNNRHSIAYNHVDQGNNSKTYN